jgi:hypothetical protein
LWEDLSVDGRDIKIGLFLERHNGTAERLPCAAGWNPMTSSVRENSQFSYGREIFPEIYLI